MLDVSRSSPKKQIRTSKISDSIFYRLASQTEKQSTHTGLPTSRCKKKGPFTIKHYVNMVKNHVGCLSKSIKKADQASKICFYCLGWSNEKQSTLVGLPTSTCKKAPFTIIHQMEKVKNHVRSLADIYQKSRSGPQKYLFL